MAPTVRETMAVGATRADLPALDAGIRGARLGIDQPAGHWPTVPRLKSFEAAGFAHVQVRMPPRHVLEDPRMVVDHAGALRDALDLTGLRPILHAPDDLLAGDAPGDRQLDGAITYAALAGCDLVVYHGARVPLGDPSVRSRLRAEEAALRHALPRIEAAGVRLAIENLAPVFPGSAYVSFSTGAVRDLVRALDSANVGMCLDLGHAHITSALAGVPLVDVIEPVLGDVILFHLHDNFGARGATQCCGGIEPLRLDLHLAPGAGTLPWDAVAPLLAGHPAPLQLEVHPPSRPEPATLAIVVRELLGAAVL